MSPWMISLARWAAGKYLEGELKRRQEEQDAETERRREEQDKETLRRRVETSAYVDAVLAEGQAQPVESLKTWFIGARAKVQSWGKL